MADTRIKAAVSDIKEDEPRKTDVFLVDAMVWLWATFPPASIGAAQVAKSKDYQNYLLKIHRAKSTLIYCLLQISEVAHVIENFHYQQFETQQANRGITPKNYRSISSERSRVVDDINGSINIIKKRANGLTLPSTEKLEFGMLELLRSFPLDAYDAGLLCAAKEAGIVQVITDDYDYAFVPGFQLFTGNAKLIANVPKLAVR